MRASRFKRRVQMGLLTSLGGVVVVLGFLPSCETVLTTANPCGTVFAFCDPYEIEQIFADLPDFEADPTCTIPFFGYDPSNNNPNGCATNPI